MKKKNLPFIEGKKEITIIAKNKGFCLSFDCIMKQTLLTFLSFKKEISQKCIVSKIKTIHFMSHKYKFTLK